MSLIEVGGEDMSKEGNIQKIRGKYSDTMLSAEYPSLSKLLKKGYRWLLAAVHSVSETHLPSLDRGEPRFVKLLPRGDFF